LIEDTIIDKDNVEKSLILTLNLFCYKDANQADYAIIHNTLQRSTNSERAVEHIYRQLRNAEPDEETARGIIDKLFFSDQRYNLGE
jgi:DNA-directed RNA polymerase subunit beta